MIDFLKSKGYVFTSQTDSELIAHLLDYNTESDKPFLKTMRETVNQLDGAFAIAAIKTDNKDSILFSKKQITAFNRNWYRHVLLLHQILLQLSELNKFIFLEDGDVAKISKDKFIIFDISDQKSKEIQEINISEKASSKANTGTSWKRKYMSSLKQ